MVYHLRYQGDRREASFRDDNGLRLATRGLWAGMPFGFRDDLAAPTSGQGAGYSGAASAVAVSSVAGSIPG